MPRVHLRIAAVTVAALLGATACSSSTSRPSASSPTTVSPQDAGLQRGQAVLDADQSTAAAAFAAQWRDQLVQAHPDLAGLSAATISPVYSETSSGPIGARALFTLPAVVPSIHLDLVRLHRSGPETMPSMITNLRSLEMIYLFDGSSVVHVGVVPAAADALDPDAETVVRPVDPEKTRSTDFGGNE